MPATKEFPRLPQGAIRFLMGFSVFSVVAGLVVMAASLGVGASYADYHSLAQPIWFAFVILLLGIATAGVLLRSRAAPNSQTATRAVFHIALFMAVFFTGSILNTLKKRTEDPGPTIAALSDTLPTTENLISFGSIDHRFCFYFGDLIQEKDWPLSMAEVPEDLDYFFMSYRESDTPEQRINGRGRSWSTTHGTLRFEWEVVQQIVVNRSLKRSHRQILHESNVILMVGLLRDGILVPETMYR